LTYGRQKKKGKAKKRQKAWIRKGFLLLFDGEMDEPRCKVRKAGRLKRQALAAILEEQKPAPLRPICRWIFGAVCCEEK